MNHRRVILVTGAAQNIGAAIGTRFLEQGATVICADLRPPANSDLEFIETDVACEDSVVGLMARIAETHGYLDVLVNNAGICVESGIAETTVQDWDRVMAVNVRSTFLTTKHALPLLRSENAEHPAIVNISSIEGLGANPLHSAYGASKAAVAAFSHNTALEYGVYGIRCNAVCPGFVKTAHGLREIAELDAAGQTWEDGDLAATQGRICEPEEVAAAALFLASDESSFVNGMALYVDNGWYTKG